MAEWHTREEVSAELGDVLGSVEERAERVEQSHRGLVLRRLVEQRRRAGLRQIDVAERMGVSKARVSHIEHGAVATIELLARYLEARRGAPGRIPHRPSTAGDRSLLGRLVIEGSFKLAEPGRRWS